MSVPSKKRKKQLVDENPIEAIRNIASDVGQSSKDMLGGVAEDAFNQIFGKSSGSSSLSPNEEVNFPEFDDLLSSKEKPQQQITGHMERGEVFSYRETVEVNKKIAELREQLIVLVKSTTALSSDIEVVAIEKTPINPGKYHVNFLEWLISLVKSLIEKVDESNSWLAVFSSKKQQRQYWSMFKKHGTSFGLSNERVVATQTG